MDKKNNIQKINCCYCNNSKTTQIVLIKDIFSYFERTVFPGKNLLFEANKDSFLEVHTLEIPTATLAERICCANLIFQKTEPILDDTDIFKP